MPDYRPDYGPSSIPHERRLVDPVEFGRRLREVRLERGMTIAFVALEMTKIWQDNHLGQTITAQWIHDVETGKRVTVDRERVVTAALVLGVRMTRLLPPLPDAEKPTDSDLVMSLRSSGFSNHDVDEILDAIQSLSEDSEDEADEVGPENDG